MTTNAAVKINSSIVSVAVATSHPKANALDTKPQLTLVDSGSSVFLERVHEKMERPEILEGRTYKIKTPLSDSAIYLVCNDVVLNAGTQHEKRLPFEIFINSKEMDNYQWVVAFTRLISAVFRKGGDVTFIIEELKSVFDPNGGYFTRRGRIPSLVAEIGYTLEEHFKYIGLIKTEADVHVQAFISEKREAFEAQGGALADAGYCPKCNAKAVIVMDGCPCCLECGESKCG